MLSLLGILKAGRTLQKFGNLKWIFRLKLGGWTRNQGYCRGGACIHSSFPKSHWGYVWAEDSIPLAVEMLQTCPGPPACSRDLSAQHSSTGLGWHCQRCHAPTCHQPVPCVKPKLGNQNSPNFWGQNYTTDLICTCKQHNGTNPERARALVWQCTRFPLRSYRTELF